MFQVSLLLLASLLLPSSLLLPASLLLLLFSNVPCTSTVTAVPVVRHSVPGFSTVVDITFVVLWLAFRCFRHKFKKEIYPHLAKINKKTR
jgi:hypothetical protein